VTAAWVAGSVRAQALARRRLGAAGARALAASPDLDEAVRTLADSPYGHDVAVGDSLARGQRGVAATLLWNLRVLAGWLPPDGAEALRLLAGWFELANIDEQLRTMAGEPAEPPFRLGALASLGPRLERTVSPAELRAVLAASAWGDPGGESPAEITIGVRLAWAGRVARLEPALPWAGGAVAVLMARQLFLAGGRVTASAAQAAGRLLGAAWQESGSVAQLRERLPAPARWPLAGVAGPDELWRAEAAWWARIATDGMALLAHRGFGPQRAIGAVALLAVDAWRVRAALELAARGGAPLEEFDALA
jgi:hypothetical protein